MNCRPVDELLVLAENAFGSDQVTTKTLPLYQDLVKYEGDDLASLLQLRVACFAISSWLTNTSAIKKYIQFCRVRQVPLYLVDLSILNLCVLNLIQERKSQQVIVNLISSVVFASNFLGCSLSTQDKQIKNTLVLRLFQRPLLLRTLPEFIYFVPYPNLYASHFQYFFFQRAHTRPLSGDQVVDVHR